MDFSDLTIRLLLLFFPGIVCHIVVDLYTSHHEQKAFEVFVQSFVYGMIAYVLYSLILLIFNIRVSSDHIGADLPETSFANALTNADVPISFGEVGLVAIVGVFLGVGISWCINKSWHFRLVQRLGVTNKFSDPNVWLFALNLSDVEWAVVRDHQQGLMYFGYIRAFRDVEEIAELLLTDVTVSNLKSGEELYRCDKVYLARPHNNVTIDLPRGGELKNE